MRARLLIHPHYSCSLSVEAEVWWRPIFRENAVLHQCISNSKLQVNWSYPPLEVSLEGAEDQITWVILTVGQMQRYEPHITCFSNFAPLKIVIMLHCCFSTTLVSLFYHCIYKTDAMSRPCMIVTIDFFFSPSVASWRHSVARAACRMPKISPYISSFFLLVRVQPRHYQTSGRSSAFWIYSSVIPTIQ